MASPPHDEETGNVSPSLSLASTVWGIDELVVPLLLVLNNEGKVHNIAVRRWNPQASPPEPLRLSVRIMTPETAEEMTQIHFRVFISGWNFLQYPPHISGDSELVAPFQAVVRIDLLEDDRAEIGPRHTTIQLGESLLEVRTELVSSVILPYTSEFAELAAL